MIESPLLAGKIKDYEKLKYPLIATPKLDGIRCLIVDGKAVSRNFKPIPNVYIREIISNPELTGLDGELVLAGGKPFNEVSSAVMSFDGEPDFEYHVFDYVSGDLNASYEDRLVNLRKLVETHGEKYKLVFVETTVLQNKEELDVYEEKCVELGYEGVMIRDPQGTYHTKKWQKGSKDNRSSEKEGILLKIKRFEDSEAEIIGFEEMMSNQNEKNTLNELGNMVRSSKKEGMVPKGTLGKVWVRDIKTGQEFKVGSGFNNEQRDLVWSNQSFYLGKILKYKYQPFGVKELPRCPIFLGFRHVNDM